MMKALRFLFLVAAAVATFAAAADEEQFSWHPYKSGLGADGWDVLAYFDGGVAEKGESQFAAEYGGLSWHFANAARRDMFLAAPEKYVPQYGGYCAYAASLNALAFGDPKIWTVHNGKLYFNYNAPTRKRWQVGINGRITKGDIYWRDVVLAEAREKK